MILPSSIAVHSEWVVFYTGITDAQIAQLWLKQVYDGDHNGHVRTYEFAREQRPEARRMIERRIRVCNCHSE